MTTRLSKTLILFVTLAALGGYARAEVPEPAEPTEQDVTAADEQLQWAQRMQQAAALQGTGKTAEALEMYQAIEKDMPGMDRGGFVALLIGDCRWQLHQYDEARSAYETAREKHAELGSTLWSRLVETDLAQGRFDAAETQLRQVMAGDADPDQKSWAAFRLAMAKEQQLIRLLKQTRDSYLQSADLYAGTHPESKCWRKTHAADLKETADQLQTAMQQMGYWQRMLPVFWTDDLIASQAAEVDLSRARIAGELVQPGDDLDTAPKNKTSVELAVDKDGKVEVSIAGHKVNVDETTQRQILKHVQQAARIAAQSVEQGDK